MRRKSHTARNAAVLLAILVAAVAAVAYTGLQGGKRTTPQLQTGQMAPAFSLQSVAGGSFNLSSYLGKSDVLLFFNEGLSCSPCLQQMLEIDRGYSTFTSMGIVVVSITADPMSDMRMWTQSNGISNMMVLVDASLKVDQQYNTLYAGSMHPGSTPGHTFILVGKDGKVLWRQDYGTYTMYVPMAELVASVRSAATSG